MNTKFKTCSECGKTFVPGYKYAYKIRNKNGTKIQCSYSCHRKAQDKEKSSHKQYATHGRRFG